MTIDMSLNQPNCRERTCLDRRGTLHSFGTQSARGNLYAERLMTVAHTARKQKKNVLEFLTACCAAARAGSTPPSLFAAA